MAATKPKVKEYQTLFWVPMLFQTSAGTQDVISEMLNKITEFHEDSADVTPTKRPSMVSTGKRRQQILGDNTNTETRVATRVEVVPKSDNTKYVILSVLKSHFLFSQMHDYELDDVIDAMQEAACQAGEVIIAEGEPGELFYILEEGSCEVTINGDFIANVAEHSSFGDLALMYNSPRAATIRATSHCTLWTLNRVFFKQAIVTSSSNQNVQLCQFLSKITLFENLGSQSLNQLARSLTKKSYADGSYIINQGEIGEEFFVIYRGEVMVTKTGDDGKETELVKLHEGEVFGERALIKKEPRAANIIAQGPVECYYLDRNNFLLMLGGLIDRMNQMNEFRILRGAPLFQGLNDKRLKILRKILNKYVLVQGQRLLQSDASNSLYIILEGQLESESTKVTYEVGDTTGSLDIDTPSGGTLVTTSDEAVVMSIHKQTLLEHIAAQEREESEIKSGTRSRKASVADMSDTADQRRDSVIKDSALKSSTLAPPVNLTFFDSELSDFKVISTLGAGTFGQVYRAMQISNSKEVALKCLDKKALVESEQYAFVRREAVALQHFTNQFIVEYYGILDSPSKVIFMLEYIRGVELWSYLYENKSLVRGPYGGIKMPTAGVYAGCILLALEHIHERGYAYRDLKPENIVIGTDGYVKLVDFGFAKPVPYLNKEHELMFRTFTLCGTPDYMAPEVVLTQGHDNSADFWAFGVLIYELLCGHTPFAGRNQQRTFEKIVHSTKFLTFPAKFDSHAKSLIRRLLHPNPSLRIGCLQNGCEDVKEHAFFISQNVEFQALINRTCEVSYKPKVEDSTDKGVDFNIEHELSLEFDASYVDYFKGLSNSSFHE